MRCSSDPPGQVQLYIHVVSIVCRFYALFILILVSYMASVYRVLVQVF